jgi:guanylate kinase
VVHGNLYGTLSQPVEDALRNNRSVLMDIDVQGARQIRQKLSAAPELALIERSFLDIFISPPSIEALEARLRKRAEDPEATIRLRLKNAAAEMACSGEFRYIVVNDDLDRAFVEFKEILKKEAFHHE